MGDGSRGHLDSVSPLRPLIVRLQPAVLLVAGRVEGTYSLFRPVLPVMIVTRRPRFIPFDREASRSLFYKSAPRRVTSHAPALRPDNPSRSGIGGSRRYSAVSSLRIEV